MRCETLIRLCGHSAFLLGTGRGSLMIPSVLWESRRAKPWEAFAAKSPRGICGKRALNRKNAHSNGLKVGKRSVKT